MVQIVPQNNVGGNIGASISEGIGSGLDFLVKSKLQEMKAQKASVPYNVFQAPGKLKTYLSDDEFKNITPEDYGKIVEGAKQYAHLGPDEALNRSYFDHSGRSPQEQGEQQQPSRSPWQILTGRGLEGQEGDPQSTAEAHQQLFEQQPSHVKNIMETLNPSFDKEEREQRKDIPGLLTQASQSSEADFITFLKGLSEQEFRSLPKSTQVQLAAIKGNIGLEELFRGLTKGVIPGGEALDKIAVEKGALPPVTFAPEETQKLMKSTGELAKDFMLFKGAGLASTVPRKVAASAGLFAGDRAFKTATEEGRSPTIAEIGRAGLEGAAYEFAPFAIGKISKAFKAIPSLFKNIKQISKAVKVGEEVVGKKVAENLAQKGVTAEKIIAKDPTALAAVKEESSKVARVFKDAEKANVKQMEKIRADVAKKLPESPLAQYYKPKKIVVSRPATIAKEEARIKPLIEKISKQKEKLKSLNAEVLETENFIRANKGKLSQEELERVGAKYQMDSLEHRKVIDNIKKLEFEKKYKRPPATTAEIKQQIDKSFAELTQAIENPSAEKFVKMKKQLAKDTDAVEIAEKLAKRGEIPGKEVMDEYIKINEQYNKAYGNLEKELKEFIRKRKPLKAPKAQTQRKNAEELLKSVQEARKASKAKVAIQKDKRKVMGALNKPSGAFYKQTLKNTGKNIEAFKKDFFKWNKIASQPQKRATEVAKKALAKPKKPNRFIKTEAQIKETAAALKNPTAQNVEKLAESTGATSSEVKQSLSHAENQKQTFKEFGEAVRNGLVDEKAVTEATKKIMAEKKQMHPLVKSLLEGAVIGTLQETAESGLGVKLPKSYFLGGSTALAMLSGAAQANSNKPVTRGDFGRGTLTTITATAVHHLLSGMINMVEENKLKKKRSNFKEYNESAKDIRDRFSKTRADKIIKASRS